jgi:hypothetical protein
MLENERVQVKDFKGRGFSNMQLQEMGFGESAIHPPSVAGMKS